MNSYENEQLSYECDLTAERDRLKAINAELLAALEGCLRALDIAENDLFGVHRIHRLVVIHKARAAIAKATGE